jgi:UDP-N-acetylglucosamine 2-epimerase
MKEVQGVVGNSSSGIIEAPSLKVGTLNIGDRQTGRVRAASVIDCPPTYEKICSALKKLLSPEFQIGLANVVNPHGGGNVSEQIVDVLKMVTPSDLIKKRFHDVNCAGNAE